MAQLSPSLFSLFYPQSEKFRPVVLPLVLLAVLLLAVFLWWKKLGCCSCCCLSCLQPRGLTKCGACQTCQYVVEGAMIRYILHYHLTLHHHHHYPQEGHGVWLHPSPQAGGVPLLQGDLPGRQPGVLHHLPQVWGQVCGGNSQDFGQEVSGQWCGLLSPVMNMTFG